MFHISTASGLKSGQSDRKRNFGNVVSYEMSESGNASTEIYTQTLTTETQKNRDNNYEPVMTKSHHPSPPL
jgi:hypothetical protein